MSRDAALLSLLIAFGAAVLVLHVALLLRAVTARQLSPWWRTLALVPVVTPVAGWRAGAHGLCLAWAACASCYGLLQLMVH